MREFDLEYARIIATNSGDIKDTIEGLIEEVERLRADNEAHGGYPALAMRTAAGPEVFYPDKLDAAGGPYGINATVLDAFGDFMYAARVLSALKASLFYGKDWVKPDRAEIDEMFTNDTHYTNFDNYQMLHAILGIGSEAGELLEDVVSLLSLKDPADAEDMAECEQIHHRRLEILQNMVREQGDVDWFQELFAHVIGVSTAASRRSNIERLRARFPIKFSEDDALARADERGPIDRALDHIATGSGPKWTDDPGEDDEVILRHGP